MAFKLENVSFWYGSRMALDDLTLEIESGRFHAIMGPNGCGKTTLLDLLSGYLPPGGGKILFDGKPVSKYGKKELAKHMALAPQNYHANFPYTVREVVGMGRYPHRSRFGPPSEEDVKAVEEAIETCGVKSLADRPVTELSGGEKQRVVFARTIAQQTPVLLLDEPCSGMDIKHALEMMKIASERVRTKGATVVAVMHDINMAVRFADNLVFMKDGRIVESGVSRHGLTPSIIKKVFDVESVVIIEEIVQAPRVVFLG